jgi:hypothetical protein
MVKGQKRKKKRKKKRTKKGIDKHQFQGAICSARNGSYYMDESIPLLCFL